MKAVAGVKFAAHVVYVSKSFATSVKSPEVNFVGRSNGDLRRMIHSPSD